MTPVPTGGAAGPEHFVNPPFQSPPAAGSIPQADLDDEEDEDEEMDVTPAATVTDTRRFPDVAREAALNAERAVIADTHKQVHWNRRKAAQLLGVSYKTLLNKIKETGLERP